MNCEELTFDKLAKAREELFTYKRAFETGMINGPEYVVDEMVAEIKRLRRYEEAIYEIANHRQSFKPNSTRIDHENSVDELMNIAKRLIVEDEE